MIRTCKFCHVIFQAYAKNSKVCDECKEKWQQLNASQPQTIEQLGAMIIGA